MRIGLVIYGSLDSLSGGFLYDRKLVEHLEASGDRVEVISLPWRNYAGCLFDNFSPAIQSRLRSLQVDALLQDELNHPSLIRINRSMSGRTGFPILSIVHHLRISEPHPGLLKRVYRRVEKAYLRSVDGYIFNSEATSREVVKLAGKGEPGIIARPGGDRLKAEITAEVIAARARKPGPLRVIFLGNLIHRKGLHTLLDALSRLPQGMWRLTAAGSMVMEPRYARKVQNFVNTRGLQGLVRFTGPLDEGQLIEAMRTHHVLAVPSIYEGFGIAYLEGMGFGLPAIGTTAGGAREIFTNGEDGFLVEPGDAETLANRLILLAQDRQLLEEMSLAARARYLSHPTWEETGRRIRQFLSGCLGEKFRYRSV
jgi:glycosyltransferase involved in cell wall biosynthesis